MSDVRRLAREVIPTPVGEMHAVYVSETLCALDFGDFVPRLRALLTRRFGAYELVLERPAESITEPLERYFGGEVDALESVRVDAGGTPYQARVWAALRTIRPGLTRTYGDLAAFVGSTHARAIGHANSLNPIAIVVPCHRVIGADAALTGYAGGLARKRWLLDHEARYAGAAPMLTNFA